MLRVNTDFLSVKIRRIRVSPCPIGGCTSTNGSPYIRNGALGTRVRRQRSSRSPPSLESFYKSRQYCMICYNLPIMARILHLHTYFLFPFAIDKEVASLGHGEHTSKEGFLIHRMFDTRYYLMAIVALFYRACLLDFAQKTALVSRRLYRDQETGAISRENIEIANALRAEFLHFSNYWYFEELANKDEEIEHFSHQCHAYRIGAMRAEVEQEIEKLNASLFEYNQRRSTEAVNRLAMVSIVFGFGAVVTGFFGMNFGGHFARLFFNPDGTSPALHYVAMLAVTLLALGAL